VFGKVAISEASRRGYAAPAKLWRPISRATGCHAPLAASLPPPPCQPAGSVSCLRLPTLAAAARVSDAGTDAGRVHFSAQLCGGGHAHPEGCCGHLLRPAWPGHAYTGSLWPPSHSGGRSSRRRAATIALVTPLLPFQRTCLLLPAPHCPPAYILICRNASLQIMAPLCATQPLNTSYCNQQLQITFQYGAAAAI
jgi:hypothetical protein